MSAYKTVPAEWPAPSFLFYISLFRGLKSPALLAERSHIVGVFCINCSNYFINCFRSHRKFHIIIPPFRLNRRECSQLAIHFHVGKIANISLEELGQTIFSASISDDKPADVLLFTDFKDFHIADHDFGVSQITCVDSNRMMQRKDEFLSVMRKTMEERGYTLMILMLTDVLLEGTHLLYLGDEDIITQAFGVQLKDHTCFLPGVVSRKKQVIPSLTALWG